MSSKAEWKFESFTFGGRVNGKTVNLAVRRGAKDRLIPLETFQKYLRSNVARLGGDEEIKVEVETEHGTRRMILVSAKGAEAIQEKMRTAPSRELAGAFIEHARRRGVTESIANLGGVTIEEESVKDKTDRNITETTEFVFPIEGYDIRARSFIRADGARCVIAVDIGRGIGHSRATASLYRISESEKGSVAIQTTGGIQVLSYLTLAGVFELCATGRTEAAVAIRRWMAKEMGTTSNPPVAEILDVMPADTLPVAATPTAYVPIEMPKWDGKGSPFDAIRELDEQGREFWSARRLMGPLGYSKWQDFQKVIQKAALSCRNQRLDVASNFMDGHKVSSGARGPQSQDYRLTRIACYLVAMNGDPSKPEIAAAQQYFAIRTHQAEEQDRKAAGGEGVGPDALAMMAKAISLLTDRSIAIEDATKVVSLDVKKAKRAVRKARREADAAKEEAANAIKAAQSAQFDAQVAKEKQEEYERIANVRMAKIQEEAELARQMASKTARTTVYDFDRELGGNVARANVSALADIGLILTDQYRRMQEEDERLPSLGKTYSSWCDNYINEYPRDLLLRNQMLFADYLNQANHITTVASHIRSARAKERSLRGNRRQSRQRRLF